MQVFLPFLSFVKMPVTFTILGKKRGHGCHTKNRNQQVKNIEQYVTLYKIQIYPDRQRRSVLTTMRSKQFLKSHRFIDVARVLMPGLQ